MQTTIEASTTYRWWYAYGPFRDGDEGLPHTGDVLRYYAELRKQNIDTIADKLKRSRRTIFQWLSKGNRMKPDDLKSRREIFQLLGIPFVLGGMANASEIVTPAIIAEQSRWEHLLSLAWALYNDSSVTKARGALESHIAELEKLYEGSQGPSRTQYDALRCRYYQAYSLVLRDGLELDHAIDYTTRALTIGLKLDNAELIASSYLRRARARIGKRDYQAAYQDAMAMLKYADLSRDPLQAKCYQMAGEATSHIAEDDDMLQAKSIGYFDKAGKIIRSGDLTPDGSYVTSDITTLYIERARALLLFGRHREALNAVQVAWKALSPSQSRWHLNLLITEARIYIAAKKIDQATTMLEEADKLARDLGIQSKQGYVRELALRCEGIIPGNERVRRLLDA